jgi:Ca-activated chloride channel family protein
MWQIWEFHNVWFLLGWAFLPFLIYRYVKSQSHPESALNLTVVKILKPIKPSFKVRLRHLPFILQMIAFALIIFALAGPRQGVSSKQVNNKGVDILLVLDVSGSMQTLDLANAKEKKEIVNTDPEDYFKAGAPQMRLSIAKRAIASFVLNRPNDRLGMVIFSGLARTACPMTLDHNTLIEALKAADFKSIRTDGTAIGDAIMTGLARLKSSESKSKVMILLTDGSNNAGQMPPEQATRVAQSLGIKIYTIGVGRSQGTTLVPTASFFGSSWQEIPLPPDNKSDDNLMKMIAESTGAQFYRAEESQQLIEIYKKIDQLEKSEMSVKSFTQYREFYGLFVLWGLMFALFGVILNRSILRRLPA